MQIQYNITRIEEWCKSHDMPEGTLQLEHLMRATKLLQLKKVCLRHMVQCVGSRTLTRWIVDPGGLGDHLRCLLDVDPNPNPTDVHELLRRRLRGT